ncbi:GGDEF domain-containing protein [Polynucleobacter paneuropaeus]|nr:GGDEF domain-containing protein [Polynucleobacter paneuropaeus]MBT8616979.1 GGDEF domain-containing protein [Polynucleobacter paneuropaeus]MBT8618859.1 GGDEF domain-containing protein [Polynucleobacter paneuropaeus]MBT8620176.1 GGDEF domain-containing protein [Polynucleobacter paneuropaeus]MBT8626276.1 GGDEF domain-containing protein [Polynucleobacter paneuropaeus]
MMMGIGLYLLAFIAQFTAAGWSIYLLLKTQSYRKTFACLSIAYILMLGRRITPLIDFSNDGNLNLVDAVLAAMISTLILLGTLYIKHLLRDLENANLALAQINKTDSLTGALSRPETFSRTLLEVERSFRTKHKLAFLMIDIDHFKLVNDTYGHWVGDTVLLNLARCCQEELRAIDIFGRVGGEEFLVVLPDTDQVQAFEVAERLRKHATKEILADVAGAEVHITISIGIAVFNPSDRHDGLAANVLSRSYQDCDQAMYQAKTAGRNQCVVSK